MSDEEAPNEEETPAEAGGEFSMDDDGEGAGGGDSKKLILFVVLPVLILLGVVGGLFVAGVFDPLLKSEPKEEVVEEGGAEEEVVEEEGDGKGGSPFVEIPTMIVNLNTDDGEPRYLRLTVQLELKRSKDAPKVEAVIPRVVDQFQTYLRELRVRDLRGSAGIYRLQMELLWRVNQAAAPVEVKDVLFQEILIQ